MMSLRALLATALVLAVANAFAPGNSKAAFGVQKTALQFGFLKELGLEKPSWLPDFGGDKAKEEPPAAEDATPQEGAEEESAVEE